MSRIYAETAYSNTDIYAVLSVLTAHVHVYAKTAYSYADIYAVLSALSIPDSSPNWLPANPGHGTKILDATVAGLPVSLTQIINVASRCVLYCYVTDEQTWGMQVLQSPDRQSDWHFGCLSAKRKETNHCSSSYLQHVVYWSIQVSSCSRALQTSTATWGWAAPWRNLVTLLRARSHYPG